MTRCVDSVGLWAGTGFFKGLDDKELQTAFSLADERRVGRHELLFRQDDPAALLYLLVEGRVKLTQLTPEGHQLLMRFVERGDMIGGVAVLSEAVYPVTAEAVVACRVLTWDGETMQGLMERFPKIALNALQHLATRVQELQRRVRELATERVEQRIARTLVRLAAQAGERSDEGVRIAMSLSRQDLGELTGTSLYTVSRTLSRWESDGLVESGRERVVIRRLHELKAIADDLPRNG